MVTSSLCAVCGTGVTLNTLRETASARPGETPKSRLRKLRGGSHWTVLKFPEGADPGGGTVIVSAPKGDEEFRDRAVRMFRDRLAEPGKSKLGSGRTAAT